MFKQLYLWFLLLYFQTNKKELTLIESNIKIIPKEGKTDMVNFKERPKNKNELYVNKKQIESLHIWTRKNKNKHVYNNKRRRK